MFPFLMTACSEAKFWAANAPVDLEENQIKTDLVFDQENNLSLDMYTPKNLTKKAPLIVFIYGGSWQDGNKDGYKFVAEHFTEKGYIVAVPDYRKFPNVKFPAFVDDGATAVAWLFNHADDYKIDASNTILMGHSAGAFNAAMLAYDQSYLKRAGANPKNIKKFIGLSGPYAFVPKAKDMKAIFGPPDNYPNMWLPHYVSAGDPPTLLIYGEKDTIVGRFNSEILEDALQQKQVPVQVRYYQNLNHVGTIAEFSWLKKKNSVVLNDIDSFLVK